MEIRVNYVRRYPSDPTDEELAAEGLEFSATYLGDPMLDRLEGEPLPVLVKNG